MAYTRSGDDSKRLETVNQMRKKCYPQGRWRINGGSIDGSKVLLAEVEQGS